MSSSRIAIRTLRRGFTLVEMLVAMVLTLLLVTAIAEFYAIVGDSVKDGRAMIEMGGQLRAAVQRLKADLDLITVTVAPWSDEGSASGYFEYCEGRANDYNANDNFDSNGNPLIDATEDTNNNGTPDILELAVTNTVGDGDDFLGFTIRSSGQPFTGRMNYPVGANASAAIVSSQMAEVVWWVGFDDLNSNNKWDFNEPRQIYRRQLLIRPDLGLINVQTGVTDYPNVTLAQQDLVKFWQFNDISASIRAEYNGTTLAYRIRANTLSDLARREYRFAHKPLSVNQLTTTGIATGLPSGVAYLFDSNFPHVQQLVPCYSAKTPGVSYTNSFALQPSSAVAGANPGEDIALTNVLAFDVQAFDPYARVWADNPSAVNSSTGVLVPSDPGYPQAAYLGNAQFSGGTIPSPSPLAGVGAYVDLGYYQYLVYNGSAVTDSNTVPPNTNTFPANSSYLLFANNQTAGWPHFAFPFEPTQPPASPLVNTPAIAQSMALSIMPSAVQTTYKTLLGNTYDTWAAIYERDGIAQTGRKDANGNVVFDLQTNGADDPSPVPSNPTTFSAQNGVDDPGERETIPAYSVPLRGIQVKIRVYEPSTRQVRQATVGTDFITE